MQDLRILNHLLESKEHECARINAILAKRVSKLSSVSKSPHLVQFKLDNLWSTDMMTTLQSVGDYSAIREVVWKSLKMFLKEHLFNNLSSRALSVSLVAPKSLAIKFGSSLPIISFASMEWDPSLFVDHYEHVEAVFKFLNDSLFLAPDDSVGFFEDDDFLKMIRDYTVSSCMPFSDDQKALFLKDGPYYKKLSTLEKVVDLSLFTSFLNQDISFIDTVILESFEARSIRQSKVLISLSEPENVLIPQAFFAVEEDWSDSYVWTALEEDPNIENLLVDAPSEGRLVDRLSFWEDCQVKHNFALFTSLLLETLRLTIPFGSRFKPFSFLNRYLEPVNDSARMQGADIGALSAYYMNCRFLAKSIMTQAAYVLSFLMDQSKTKELACWVTETSYKVSKLGFSKYHEQLSYEKLYVLELLKKDLFSKFIDISYYEKAILSSMKKIEGYLKGIHDQLTLYFPKSLTFKSMAVIYDSMLESLCDTILQFKSDLSLEDCEFMRHSVFSRLVFAAVEVIGLGDIVDPFVDLTSLAENFAEDSFLRQVSILPNLYRFLHMMAIFEWTMPQLVQFSLVTLKEDPLCQFDSFFLDLNETKQLLLFIFADSDLRRHYEQMLSEDH